MSFFGIFLILNITRSLFLSVEQSLYNSMIIFELSNEYFKALTISSSKISLTISISTFILPVVPKLLRFSDKVLLLLIIIDYY